MFRLSEGSARPGSRRIPWVEKALRSVDANVDADVRGEWGVSVLASLPIACGELEGGHRRCGWSENADSGGSILRLHATTMDSCTPLMEMRLGSGE